MQKAWAGLKVVRSLINRHFSSFKMTTTDTWRQYMKLIFIYTHPVRQNIRNTHIQFKKRSMCRIFCSQRLYKYHVYSKSPRRTTSTTTRTTPADLRNILLEVQRNFVQILNHLRNESAHWAHLHQGPMHSYAKLKLYAFLPTSINISFKRHTIEKYTKWAQKPYPPPSGAPCSTETHMTNSSD